VLRLVDSQAGSIYQAKGRLGLRDALGRKGRCAGLTLRWKRRVLLVGAERGRAGGVTEDAW
jgi:hypothetical protein